MTDVVPNGDKLSEVDDLRENPADATENGDARRDDADCCALTGLCCVHRGARSFPHFGSMVWLPQAVCATFRFTIE